MAAAVAARGSVAVGRVVAGRVARPDVGGGRGVGAVGMRGGARKQGRCAASQSAADVQAPLAGAGLNGADELLAQWAKQPPSGPGSASETEAVRRLFMWDALPKKDEVQVFSVYEINEHDRDSPAFLPFSTINISKAKTNTNLLSALQNLFSTLSGGHEHGLGDLVPFTNKLYDSTLSVRLGVTAGLTMVVKAYPGQGEAHLKKQRFFFPDRYEAMYTFYLGDMGHVSAQGPFSTFEDTLLTITGGAGLFREATGVVHLHNLTPFKLFYTFHVRGVPGLPTLLTSTPVAPTEAVQPRKPGSALPNYTD